MAWLYTSKGDKNMRYIVSVGYRKFAFSDPLEAIPFAERAKKHYVADDEKDKISVEIELVDDEPAVAENKED